MEPQSSIEAPLIGILGGGGSYNLVKIYCSVLYAMVECEHL